MSNTNRDLIAELAAGLARQHYSPVVVRNYCAYARDFLAYLAQHEIPVTAVTSSQAAQYLRHATVTFRKRRCRPPSPHWRALIASTLAMSNEPFGSATAYSRRVSRASMALPVARLVVWAIDRAERRV